MSLLRLLDISGCFWPIWRAKEAAGKPIGEAAAETVQILRERAAASGADFVVACCDAPGRTFRHEIALEYRQTDPEYRGYKAHRPEKDAAMMACLDRVIAELEADGVSIFRVPGFEADDVIATLTTWATANGIDTEVVSEDKDLLQLVRDANPEDDSAPCVAVVRRDGTRQDSDACVKRLGLPPQLVAQFLAMAGDASDGVIGIPGVGGGWAVRLLWGRMVEGQWRPSPFRSFQAIVDAAIEDQAAVEQSERERAEARANKVRPLPAEYKAKFPENVRKSLIANGANFGIGLRLTALRTDVPLDFAQVTAPRTPKPDPRKTTIDPIFADMSFEEGTTMSTTEAEYAEPSNQNPVAVVAPANDAPSAPPSQVTAAAPPVVEITPPKKEQSLAVVQAQALAAPGASREFERQLEPGNFVQAVKLAEAIARTRKVKDVTSADDVLMQMAFGRSIGLNLYQAICQFYMVEGRGTMSAQLVVARVRQHPDCVYFRKRSGDATSATWESKRKGEGDRVATYTFSIEDAKRAKLGGYGKKEYGGDFSPDSNWTKYRQQMLSWRAALFLAREEWTEVAAGIYDPDELREQRDAPSMEDAA